MWRLCFKGFKKKAIEKERNRELEMATRRRRNESYSNLRRFLPVAPPRFSLKCTLEELYSGATKRIKLYPDIHYGFGNAIYTLPQEDIIVKVPPGLSHGDLINLLKTREVQIVLIPPDVVLVVQEEPHPVFKRVGSDLWMRKEMTLVEALTEDTITVELLDKRILTIQKPQQPVVPPIKIVNEGMLDPNIGIKGSLFVECHVVFPTSLNFTEEQEEELKKLLSEEVQ